MKHFQNKAVLVSGGAGFIGSHLVEDLVARGARVTVLDNGRDSNGSNLRAVERQILRIRGDVRDYAMVEATIQADRPDFVFHLAANASVPGSCADPRYDFETNCGGTFVVLDALRRLAPSARVVFCSSAAIYGEPERFPIRETSPLSPISPYGASKLSAEAECQMFHGVYGLPVVIGRLFNTYGPRMPRFVVLDFLKKLQKDPDRLEILGSGQQVRDFNYVSDTVAALILLALRGAPGQAYNIASGTSHSVTELATMLLEILGLEGRTRITYTGRSWTGDAQRWEVDTTRVQRMGYQPRIDLKQGLRLVVDWFSSSEP